MIDPREIERLVELSGLATEGPWACGKWNDQAEAVTIAISGDYRVEHPTPGIRGGNYRDTKWGTCEDDAEFIAALVNFFRAHSQALLEVEKDARRYRWLRGANSIMPGTPGKPMIEWYAGTDLDAAIDAKLRERS